METKDKKKLGSQDLPDGVSTSDALASDGHVPESQAARRRVLIAGLVAAQTVLSLMNRSAWGGATFLSCSLVASYVNAGNRWQSPRPSNANGTLNVGPQDINNCRP